MNILAIGINHKTAGIEIREKFYFTPLEQELLLSELKNQPALIEAFILSTCNRTELYLSTLPDTIDLNFVLNLFGNIKKIKNPAAFKKYFYIYSQEEAVRHLFRVTSALDSLVLGERQILGQVRSSFEKAKQKGLIGRYFNIMSNLAIRTGKKAQSETHISYGGSSVSWAAVSLAEELLGSLKERSVLIMGAGKMSELAVGQMVNKKFRKLYLMNRTQANAEALAQQYCCMAAPFCDLKEILAEVDLCICSVSAPHYIVDELVVRKVMASRQNKLIFIDISMPRNIDPQVAAIPHVHLFEIDDLDRVVTKNMEKRKTAAEDVSALVDRNVKAFYQKIQKLTSVSPTDYLEPTPITQ